MTLQQSLAFFCFILTNSKYISSFSACFLTFKSVCAGEGGGQNKKKKSSDLWVCPLILNSHSIRPCISLPRKFNNHQNAQHTFAVHYKHLRPALQLLVHLKLFSFCLTHMRNIRGLMLLD